MDSFDKKMIIESKIILLCIPLVVGLAGLALMAGEPFTDALFHCICMYVLNYQETPANGFVELARWTAPLAAVGGVVMAITAARDWLHNFFRYCRGKSIAVFGPETEKRELLARLGKRGINVKDRFVFAQRYILLDDEAKNFNFYDRYREVLKGHDVYLRCRPLQAHSIVSRNLHPFCPEEMAARLFWKKRYMYNVSKNCGHQMQIVFLGFGALGEELLHYALLNNIFSPTQRIEYHIFGNGDTFSAIHTGLASISDPVEFHQEAWHTQLSLLEQAQALIVLEQENQLTLLEDLLLATTRSGIDVFVADRTIMELFAAQKRLELFYWIQEVQKPEYILNDMLIEQAKRIHLHYASIYDGVPEKDENMEKEWQKLDDAFLRYSNISAADYHEVRLKMLASMGQPADVQQLSPELLDLLAELEHIRWCRHHYLNNWEFGIPENGTRKDPQKRIHADLLPFEKLSDVEREKDRESVRLQLSVFH